jgi:hypothetical protein
VTRSIQHRQSYNSLRRPTIGVSNSDTSFGTGLFRQCKKFGPADSIILSGRDKVVAVRGVQSLRPRVSAPDCQLQYCSCQFQTLSRNTTGIYNVATGWHALNNNTRLLRHFRSALRERLAARTGTTNKKPLKSSAPLDGSGTA